MADFACGSRISNGDGRFFFMDVESDVELGCVSKFVFIICNVLNVDRSHRLRVGAIAHDLNQTRHLPINLKFDRMVRDWNQSQP